MAPSSANELNNYDKLYLLMFKWRIIKLFNPLCYAAGVTSVIDLEQQILTNLDYMKKKLPGWSLSPSFDGNLETIRNMIEDSKTVKYEDLPELLGIPKNNYKEELEAAGVPLIQKDCVSVQTKIALGCPYSGDVYNAQLTQGQKKIGVVLRYDLDPAQRESFIREAKTLASLQHEYIMKCYGVVILGSYADSVGLVVELFSKGNLEEFRVPSLFHAWLYASQLSSVLEYLDSKKLVHTSVVEPFIYIASLDKISVGGFMCCCYEEDIGKTQSAGVRVTSGYHGHGEVDNSLKGTVGMFAHLVLGMFRYLDSHRSTPLLKLFPKHDKMWPLVCPSGIASLLNQCLDEDVNKRPTFQEIHQILAKERPLKLCFTTSNSSAELSELSYEEGDKVWVISSNVTGYHGWWFGQKENRIAGFFERSKAIEIDDDDQVPHEIIARGSAAELAYKFALLEGKVKVCRARLLIIGQDRAGKTSLKKSLIGLPFNPEEPSTEVLEMNSSKLEVNMEQVVEWKVISDDEVEQARPQDLSIARLVVENMKQKKENKEVQISQEKEKETHYERDVVGPAQPNSISATHNASALPSPTEEVSTYRDLVDGSGSEGNLPQKAKIIMPKELAPLVTECLKSPNTPSSGDTAAETVLDIWDFAGQHLYYATHPVFFSHKAIYLLVHNLQKNPSDLAEPLFKCGNNIMALKNFSNETNLDMLLSWLVSVHSILVPATDKRFIETCKLNLHCLPPPVLVVGTHADQVSAQEMDEVETQIASSMKGKTYQEHVLGPFYRVDNTQSSNSPAVREIQTRVQQLMSSGLNSTVDLPVKWLNFEKAVKNLAGEKFFITLEEIGQLAKQQCFIDDAKQLDAMLNYYHDLGLIIRFSDTVVLNTQWLINLFKKLITTCPFQEQDAVDRKLWQELETTGVLHIKLISKVFEDLHGSGREALQPSVLDMMEKYGFLAKFHHHYSDSNEVKYFVPAQLRVPHPELWKLAPQDSDPCSLIFNFCNGFVPHGLFPQLVSHLIAHSPMLECTEDPKLYCNGAHFVLGKKSQFDLVLLCSKHCIKLIFKGYNTDSEQGFGNSLAVHVRTLIEQELERLCQQWHWLGNVHYDVCISCSACNLSSATQCNRHKSAFCLDQDCMHLLPISSVAIQPVTLFTCREQVGEHSRFKLPNLHKWYPNSTTEEEPPENDHNLEKIVNVNIITLAGKIPVKWKVIGRLLGLEDSHISQIEMDNKDNVYEQSYAMLNAWKRNQPETATCEQLKKALSHEIVMKKDLVPRFCYRDTGN